MGRHGTATARGASLTARYSTRPRPASARARPRFSTTSLGARSTWRSSTGLNAYPFPELEYWALYPHIRPGGMLVVDDIHLPTLANIFAVLRPDRMWKAVEVVDNTAFLRRTDARAIDPYGDDF